MRCQKGIISFKDLAKFPPLRISAFQPLYETHKVSIWSEKSIPKDSLEVQISMIFFKGYILNLALLPLVSFGSNGYAFQVSP